LSGSDFGSPLAGGRGQRTPWPRASVNRIDIRADARTYYCQMTSAPKRRLLDRIGPSATFVAPGCRLAGDFETEGALLLCGSIRGDGRVGGALSLTLEAQWEGEVHAAEAVIAGRFVGRLVVAGKLEIGPAAVIRADIVAHSVAIAQGAVVDGEVTVTGGEPILRFEERRERDRTAGVA
jgi:cytoskeletal protein CcmA (bactofilin family)